MTWSLYFCETSLQADLDGGSEEGCKGCKPDVEGKFRAETEIDRFSSTRGLPRCVAFRAADARPVYGDAVLIKSATAPWRLTGCAKSPLGACTGKITILTGLAAGSLKAVQALSRVDSCGKY
jgi:hypothetical protein